MVGASGAWIELFTLDAEEADNGSSPFDAPYAVLTAPAEISRSDTGWLVKDKVGRLLDLRDAASIECRPARSGDLLSTDADDRWFDGALRFVMTGDSADEGCDVVNHIPLELYLPGVLHRELFRHWELETFCAQAIAARSFACSEHAYFKTRRHYDLQDTAASQVYGGALIQGTARRAAAETKGVVLSEGGALVPGYYSSCCGGTAATAVDAIGEHPFNHTPALAGRAEPDVCTGAPLYRWEAKRTTAALLERLRAYGEGRGIEALAALTQLRSIAVSERNAHGRPSVYVVRGAGSKRIELPAETLRRAADQPVEGLEASSERIWSSFVNVRVAGRTTRFAGRGHGHGAGLCQYGAQALAKAGEDAEAIVKWYYPQVELVQAFT
jgi:stage II sporulation protein D